MKKLNTNIPIPERLAKRPRYKGLPIPLTTLITDGVPDFKVTDMEGWEIALAGRRCGLCGEPLEELGWTTGGPNCVATRCFFDPPMHLDCLMYAMRVCPFIAMGRGYAKDTEAIVKKHEAAGRVEVSTVAGSSDGKSPDKFYIFGAPNVVPAKIAEGEIVLHIPTDYVVAILLAPTGNDSAMVDFAENVTRIYT